MDKLKWCRCDEPDFGNGIRPSYPPKQICDKCNKEWRKWKDIRGTELLDYPIGTTEFRLRLDSCFNHMWDDIRIRLFRTEGGIIVLQLRNTRDDHIAKSEWRQEDVGFFMLQDRFEIVEDCDG